MRKTYTAPTAQAFDIQLSESIAASCGSSGEYYLKFTQVEWGCRLLPVGAGVPIMEAPDSCWFNAGGSTVENGLS